MLSNLDGMYQRLIDALQEGILFCDRKGIIRILNKCYANLLGGEVSSFLGKSIEDVNPATRAYVVMENGREELANLCTLPLFGNEYKKVLLKEWYNGLHQVRSPLCNTVQNVRRSGL